MMMRSRRALITALAITGALAFAAPAWAQMIIGSGVAAAPAGQLTGSTLAAGVTASSLTSLGSGVTLTDPIDQGFVVSTSILSKTDSTLAAVPGLSVTLTAGKTYNCRGHLNGTSGTTGGIRAALVAGGSLSATSMNVTGILWNGVALQSNIAVTALGALLAGQSTIYTDIYIDGSIVVNVGGTINVHAAQNVTNATPSTVAQGATFSCTRVN